MDMTFDELMKDMSVLREPPFTEQGSIVDVFSNITVWHGVLKVINTINALTKNTYGEEIT